MRKGKRQEQGTLGVRFNVTTVKNKTTIPIPPASARMGDGRIGAYRDPWWVRSRSRPVFLVKKRHVPYFVFTGSAAVDIPLVGVSRRELSVLRNHYRYISMCVCVRVYPRKLHPYIQMAVLAHIHRAVAHLLAVPSRLISEITKESTIPKKFNIIIINKSSFSKSS